MVHSDEIILAHSRDLYFILNHFEQNALAILNVVYFRSGPYTFVWSAPRILMISAYDDLIDANQTDLIRRRNQMHFLDCPRDELNEVIQINRRKNRKNKKYKL